MGITRAQQQSAVVIKFKLGMQRQCHPVADPPKVGFNGEKVNPPEPIRQGAMNVAVEANLWPRWDDK